MLTGFIWAHFVLKGFMNMRKTFLALKFLNFAAVASCSKEIKIELLLRVVCFEGTGLPLLNALCY